MSRPLRSIARAALLAAPTLAFALISGAGAQMQLQGAANPVHPSASTRRMETGSSGPSGSSATAKRAPPKPIEMAPPSADTIIGQPLSHDGNKGVMTFGKSGEFIVLTKLTLTGEKISKPGDACTVDVSMADPVTTISSGRPAGAIRLDVPVQACPFTADVLDGAVLVSRPAPTCDFTAADCRVSPGGLWGPAAADITSKRIKGLEHERVRIETTMRANFRALMKRAGKDRAAVKAIARDQAAFSSEREMICRDYQKESVHGFCSTQVTEARALAILTKFGADLDVEDLSKREARQTRKKLKPRPSPKPEETSADPQ